MRGRIALIVLTALTSTSARGQEQDYNEDKVPLGKVPSPLVQKAEKEAPGVRFVTVYRDQEKGHRLVGKKDDGSTVSVRFDRDGRLTTVRTSTDVTMSRLPKSVASALQGEIRKRPELGGFKTLRSSLVDVFDAFKNENASFYEFFGINGKNLYYRAEIDKEGEVRKVKDILLHPSYHIQRQSFSPTILSPEMRQGMAKVAPRVTFTRVVKQISTKSGLPPDYFVYGRDEKNRAVEIRAHSNGSVHTVIREIPLQDVPFPALDALKSLAERDKTVKGFRPTEARQMRLLALNGDIVYLLYGDDADGKAVEVQVRDDGTASVSADDRDDWEVSSPALASGDAIPAKGFAVLAARFGRESRWGDVTDHVRSVVSGGRLDFQPNDLPDPAFGSPKGLVIAYSVNGKVGLSTTKDLQKVELPPPAAEPKNADVPPGGFAVLAARYGAEEKWADATDALRSRVSRGRLEVTVPSLHLPDPFFGTLKAIAVAYSVDGKVGLAVIPEDRQISLPLEGPPLNSFTLEGRRIEFAQVVTGVAFTPDGKQVVAGVEDGTVRVLDVATGREAHRFEGHGKGKVVVAVAPSGNSVISGGADNNLRLWDLKAGRERTIFRGHTGGITDIALSPNGRLAASSSWDKSARIWDVATGKQVQLLEGHAEVVMGMAFTPDNRQVVTTSWDQSARVWDVATGRELRKTEGDNGTIGDVAVSRDGRRVYFGDKHHNLKIWEPVSGNAPVDVPTYMECGWSIAPFPDGRRVLLTDENAAVVWDLKTNRPELRLDRHTGRVVTLAVSNDGRRVVTGSQDRSVRIWNLP